MTKKQRQALAKRWPNRTMEQRFWLKVNKTPECWLWIARKTPLGYGQFQIQVGLWEYAHRMAYCFSKGSIPKNLEVMHACDIRHCCNPEHLSLGTHQQNMQYIHRKRKVHA